MNRYVKVYNKASVVWGGEEEDDMFHLAPARVVTVPKTEAYQSLKVTVDVNPEMNVAVTSRIFRNTRKRSCIPFIIEETFRFGLALYQLDTAVIELILVATLVFYLE